ncbi:hypothetical protein JTE90_013285 [Oedothorax gibbosus]|uniref:Uncharacterized protein n=1 Tax=Oedothorax gibbosus TaxID=931172 RepID=A0AAV6VEU5_9ARAC|nr:hypothetical protein JTE90_013285 [Oedothorax gibbosus]
MKAAVVVAILSVVLGLAAANQYAATVFPYYQKSSQVFTLQETTTPKPFVSTEISLSPQTSVSAYHTVVRNKPAYPYPYTESTMQSEGSEDTSYYYTYEDASEENGKASSTTPIPAVSTTAKTIRSFWNSQRAQLEARRKESAQKLMPTYNKPTAKVETKPKIEFKVRDKPKFGLAGKNKATTTESTVTQENQPQNVQTTSTTTPRPKKFKLNLVDEKDSETAEVTKGSSSKSSGPALENQIVGRIGEIPLPNKFNNQNANVPALVKALNPSDPFMIDLRKRQQSLTPNQQSILATNQQIQESIQALLNSNQQTLLNNQPQVLQQPQPQPILRSNQQPLLNSNQLPLVNHIQQPSAVNRPALQTFLSTSPSDNTEQYVNTNSPTSTLLQRLGNLGINLGGADLGGGLIQGRETYGGPSGLSFNLGPVSDPFTVILKLLSLLPRPLLDLNGRLFFGIELGKNAGLTVGGGGKPIGKPIG